MSEKYSEVTTEFPDGWYPVARVQDIGIRPLRKVFQGTPIVLFRANGKISALHDRCPHRSARLSDGKVVGGDIECPYHGWRFDGTGVCTAIPLHEGKLPRRLVPALQAVESAGLIFLRSGSKGARLPHIPFWSGPPSLRIVIPMQTRTTLVDLAENAFEPIHSLFVHRHLSRSLSGNRTNVKVKLFGADDRVEMTMEGEQKQNGWMSRLLEGQRSINKSALIAPGIMEVQYWSNDKLSLAATLYFTPTEHNIQSGYMVVQAPRAFGLGYLKALIFYPMLRTLLHQDKIMLRSTQANWEDFGKPAHANSPLDFLRIHVEAVLRNERPAVADQPQEFILKL